MPRSRRFNTSRSPGGSRRLDDDESQPLLPDSQRSEGRHFQTLEHMESIYSVMFLLPPFWLNKYGEHSNIKVPLALALCVLSCIIQTTLTSMTGHFLIVSDHDFQDSLLEHSSGSVITPDYMRFLNFYLPGETTWFIDLYEKYHDAHNEYAYGCCDHVGCSGGYQPCCAPTELLQIRRSGKRSGLLQVKGDKLMAAPPSMDGFGSAVAIEATRPARANQHSEMQPEQESHGEDTSFMRTAMCRIEDGGLVCTQPTFSYVDLWDELDADDDGNWTLSEAAADETNLACRTGLTPQEVFRSVCRGVSRLTRFNPRGGNDHDYFEGHRLPEEVKERTSIPRKLFEWWRQLAIICSVDDVARCQGLIRQGVFDGWMKAPDQRDGRVRGIDAALDYCQRLLAPNGWCDKTLPATYMMYRDRAKEKCGEASHNMGPGYVNPHNHEDEVHSMVDVHYAQVTTFETVCGAGFFLFLFLVLLLWWTNLVGEAETCWRLADFLWNFPADDGRTLTPDTHPDRFLSASQELDAEQARRRKSEKCSVRITAFTKTHSILCWILLISRIYICFLLAYMGSIFLLSNYTFIDLLTNAVALAFVFEVPELIYHYLVEKDVKDMLSEELEPLVYESYPPPKSVLAQVMFSKYFLSLVLIPIACMLTLAHTYFLRFVPILDSLECLCHQKGARCAATPYLTRGFWNTYWSNSFKGIAM